MSERFNEENEDIRFSIDTDIESVNRRFNEELDSLTAENADRKILDCGMPSAILRSAGVPEKRLRLYDNKVVKKARKHGFGISFATCIANPDGCVQG